ncbi:MAG: hypothetical protein V2B18_23500 [Pseudomonadota bacterium]
MSSPETNLAPDADSLAIQIIPDLTIDEKYSTIIADAFTRIKAFTDKAVNDNRVHELFVLERSKMDQATALKVLNAEGRLVVGFQFEAQPDALDENFRVFVKKALPESKTFRFYLSAPVQQIMLQLISLEDRRTLAIFSMLNTALDLGYRILTTLYGNQLKRLIERAPDFIRDSMKRKLEKLKLAKSTDGDDLWKAEEGMTGPAAASPQGNRPGSQDNLLQVMVDDETFEQINQYVESIVTGRERIRSKRKKLEENPQMPRRDMYEQMVREDFSQLENCYARMHIYMKAFYKNQATRNATRNKILRQFFAGQIEQITGETSLLEDLLSLNEAEYFKNIDRHNQL